MYRVSRCRRAKRGLATRRIRSSKNLNVCRRKRRRSLIQKKTRRTRRTNRGGAASENIIISAEYITTPNLGRPHANPEKNKGNITVRVNKYNASNPQQIPAPTRTYTTAMNTIDQELYHLNATRPNANNMNNSEPYTETYSILSETIKAPKSKDAAPKSKDAAPKSKDAAPKSKVVAPKSKVVAPQ